MARNKEFDEAEVLTKAMELFWKQGYEKTSLNDLVVHMGIHRRSLYDTFGDKHTLFLKALDNYREFIKVRLSNFISNSNSSKEKIRSLFEFMIEGNLEGPFGCMFVNSATELGPFDNEIKERIEEVFYGMENMIANLIKKGQEQGDITTKYDSVILAKNIHNSLIGIRVLVRTSRNKEDLINIANLALEILN